MPLSHRLTWLRLTVLSVFALPVAALAQAVDPVDPANLDAIAILIQALSQGPAGVALAVASGVLLLVQLVKMLGRKLHPIFDDPRMAVAITIVGTLTGSIVVVLSGGGSITLAVVLNALLAALAASGLFSWKQAAVSKAEEKGELAAAQIGGKAAVKAALEAAGKR